MKNIVGGVAAPKGFKAGGMACGIKKTQKLDLALIASDVPAVAAGIFTTNLVQAAPLLVTKRHLKNGVAQAIIANSGNANACVGPVGDEAAERMAEAAAKWLKIAKESVLVASTGVIGVPLPVEKIEIALEPKLDLLKVNGGAEAAQAIMTTDTFPKETAVEFDLDGVPVRIGGIAKGSGMIHPNMATMLGFVTTDVAISQELLHKVLARAGEVSFNRITVDGDTSTNDCLLVLANGMAGNKPIEADGPGYQKFLEALTQVCLELAKLIARDGEGATKFVEIKVTGAKTEAEAVKIGKSVATSNLVKTAIFGEDANWGRILAAAGYSGVQFDPSQVDIFLGELLVCRGGVGLAFDEVKAKQILEQKDLLITLMLREGKAEASVWTCDLSYDYVKINGSYRT
jgi:glutamate N-acetyltransferase / amino-acid N-acetyltransferase